MTVNGAVSPSHAAAVGALVADPERHAAILDLLVQTQPETTAPPACSSAKRWRPASPWSGRSTCSAPPMRPAR